MTAERQRPTPLRSAPLPPERPNSERAAAPAERPTRPRLSALQRLARLPLAMMVTSLLAALGIVQLTFQLGNTLYRSVTWTGQTRVAQAHIRQLEQDVRVLQDAQAHAQDPAYLRELARCQGFVGSGEQVVVSPDAPDTPGENCAPVRMP